VWWCLPGSPARAAEPTPDLLADQYVRDVRPLVQRYCQRCHGAKRAEAEINLEPIASAAEVRKHLRVWQKAGPMLDTLQMPPQEARQPSDAERARLTEWVHRFLLAEASARAGDPGPVVVRRLSNAEYTYTLRDLTGLETLDPAREFPVDGAAGEGFTNTGNALVMSPALLTKYLDAAKEIAGHAVLLPDGIRFSPHTTRRDWTDEVVARIRRFYQQFTDTGGSREVNLQGLVWDTGEGGRLPVDKYLDATLREREALLAKRKTVPEVARQYGLNAKYLGTLWQRLTDSEPSLLLDGLRARWRTAKSDDGALLATDVAQWQKALWKFGTVGHIGKVGGPKAWLEPVDPLVARQDVRLKIPAAADDGDVTLALVASAAGDGNAHDFVLWQQPRLVAPGRPDLWLRDIRDVSRVLARRRTRLFARTVEYLAAATEADAAGGKASVAHLATKHGLEADALSAWLDYLGIGTGGPVHVESYLQGKISGAKDHAFITGWGRHETPLLVANPSDQLVHIPGHMKPRSVAVHPSPTLQAAVGWRSPVSGVVRVEAKVTHAHPECGNGVTWSLELRRGATRRRLGAGTAQGSKPVPVGPIENLRVQPGDLISLLIGPRNGNHACDLTDLELTLTESGAGGRRWNLAQDVSGNVQTANPHADRFGNEGVWHFYTEPDDGQAATAPVVPAGSLLAQWHSAPSAAEKQRLAHRVQQFLTSGPPAAKDSPDAALYRQIASRGGPLLSRLWHSHRSGRAGGSEKEADYGIDPTLFGRHPSTGRPIDARSLCVQAPAVLQFRLPADLVAGYELVTTGQLDPQTGAEGSVQLQVVAGTPARTTGLLPSQVSVTVAQGPWTSDNRRTAVGLPIVVNERSAARKQIEAALEEYRQLFPAALCYTKIVPVDEVVTLTLFYREDHHLVRLMLDQEQEAQLNRLWDELHYISHDALTLVDAYAQLMEYATQDADPKVFEPLRKPIHDRAAAFRRRLVETEPRHLDALLDFASRAYRRPLTAREADELRHLYLKLRRQELPHNQAVRLTLARVLVAPAFLYRLEEPGPGPEARPVSDWELASRLSYFLWASLPDAELRQVAATGHLHNPDTLDSQLDRMLKDERTRRLATEFACQWLHVYDFDHLDEKSDRHFPTFAGLRGAMYEETIRFFTDLFQHDGMVFDILDTDHTFLNEALAKHYGIPGVQGPQWRRVDGVKPYSRGGILAQATTLAKQSGASRTSPILRGNWISEALLGDRLPRPPKDVPRLAEDETATEGRTVRQLVEKHSSDPKCMVCHQRIDPFGFALEGFDAIGRRRDRDLGDRPIDTHVKTPDGVALDGIDGLRIYLLTKRRAAFVRQFCRKLLGYALGRAIQLSDEPLLTAMQTGDGRIRTMMEMIVRSPQYREIRGRAAPTSE
jgi:hypothetical protein